MHLTGSKMHALPIEAMTSPRTAHTYMQQQSCWQELSPFTSSLQPCRQLPITNDCSKNASVYAMLPHLWVVQMVYCILDKTAMHNIYLPETSCRPSMAHKLTYVGLDAS